MQWERWAPAAGIAFVVLVIVGISLDNTPDSKSSAAKFVSFYAKSSNRTQLIIEAYLLAVAALGFLVFVVALYNRLRSLAGEEDRFLATVILASGVLFTAMLFAFGAASAAVAGAVTFGSQPVPPGDLARFVPQIGDALFLLYGMFSAAALVACTSIASLRVGLLPRWLAWAGFVVAVAALFGVAFLPALLLLLWVLVVSILLMLRPTEAR